MVIIGAAHGLIFLPVLLSFVGKLYNRQSKNQINYILFLGPPYFPIKIRSPYPKDLSKIIQQPPPAPYSSLTDEHHFPKDSSNKNKEVMYPTLPNDVDVSTVLPYADPGDYGPPTYPRQLPTERTPLLQ